MVALGDLPPIDAAIHADTTHERSATYAFAAKWTPWLEAHGVRVVTVSDPEQAAKVTTEATDIPAYTLSETGKPGRLRRQCTGRWKIDPIRQWIREHRGKRQQVEQLIGYSLDEVVRIKPSDVKYITLDYPLIDLRMSVADCVTWLGRKGLDVPTKSACVFCPFHSPAAWYRMKDEGGPDWQQAVETDRAIRDARSPFRLYMHRACIPLESITTPKENGQGDFWEADEECGGVCFI